MEAIGRLVDSVRRSEDSQAETTSTATTRSGRSTSRGGQQNLQVGRTVGEANALANRGRYSEAEAKYKEALTLIFSTSRKSA